MNYQEKFQKLNEKKEKALIPFVVIGDPDFNTSLKIVKTLIESGADILELGLPFSDPIADGPTIQAADVRASKITADDCFKFIKEIRKFSDIPIGLLVYSNLIYQRPTFFEDCKEVDVTSVLAADLPPEEKDLFLPKARKNNIDTVFIVSPLTGQKRLKSILKNCTGFVYLVSRLGVTGANKDLNKGILDLVKKVKKETALPICVGFGISKPEHVRSICKEADAAIVGSGIAKLIENNLNNKEMMLEIIKDYTIELKKATK